MEDKYRMWLSPEGLEQLKEWAGMGLSDKQLAHNCGIGRTTLSEWKRRFPELADALNQGKEVVDLQVENALLQRALGYEYTEVTEEERDGVLHTVKRVTKQMAPDVSAMLFWLKNRRPDVWRDKQEVHSDGEITVKLAGPWEEWSK